MYHAFVQGFAATQQERARNGRQRWVRKQPRRGCSAFPFYVPPSGAAESPRRHQRYRRAVARHHTTAVGTA